MGCSSLQGTGDKGYITSDGRVTEVAAGDREKPVDLEGKGVDGEDISLETLRGQPVVVVVWGSWCAPCRAEAPELVEAANELKGRASFLGINIRDASEDNSKSFMRTFKVPYPSVFSPSGEALLSFKGTLTPNTIPSTVVLDGEGRVAASIIGELPSKLTLTNLVDTVLDEGTDG